MGNPNCHGFNGPSWPPISPTGDWRKARSESPTGPRRSDLEGGPGLDILLICEGRSPVDEVLSNDGADPTDPMFSGRRAALIATLSGLSPASAIRNQTSDRSKRLLGQARTARIEKPKGCS